MTRKHSKRARRHGALPENNEGFTLSLKPLARYIRQASLPAGLMLSAGAALAGPTGGNVVAGQGNISTPNVNTTIINQQSHNLAVDWNTFNIGVQELVQFNQPANQANALNRILDQSPSQIFGSLRANGNVVLVNPNGVFFSPTATVHVGSIVASGLNIETNDFMAGDLNFQSQVNEEGGMVVNQGLIQAATGGSVSLIGGAVRNEGVILATAGQVSLVAGNKVTMDFDGDGLLQFAVDAELLQNVHDLDDAVSNTGEISADGGSVLLQGSAARDVFSNVVNNEGVIKAGRIDNSGGSIRLIAGGAGNSLINTGTLDASGSGGDGGTIKIYADNEAVISGESFINTSSDSANGGTAHILGDRVGLFDSNSVNASGATGGGTILVGGDYQGSNSDILNATVTYVGDDVNLNANANTDGEGGKVVVWADDTTRYYGHTSVRGGENSGDGGFIEISGKKHLIYRGTADGTAQAGYVGGSILFDPQDIILHNVATNETQTRPTQDNQGDNEGVDVAFNTLPDENSDATFNTVATQGNTIGSFEGFNQVSLQADRDILLNSTWNVPTSISSGGANASVTLAAGRNIVIGNGGTADLVTGKVGSEEGDVNLFAGDNIILNGNIITDNAGVITLIADATTGQLGFTPTNFAANPGDTTGAILYTSGTITQVAGTLTLTAAETITATVDAPAASLTTTAAGAAGDITLINNVEGGLDTSDITVAIALTGQTVDLTADSWDVDAALNVGGANLTLTASAGDINDVGGGGAILTADTLTLKAPGGGGVGTTAARAVNYAATTVHLATTAEGTAGSINITTAGAEDIGDIATLTTHGGSLQHLHFRALSWTVDAARYPHNDSLILEATGGSITDGDPGNGGAGIPLTGIAVGFIATGGIDVTTVTNNTAAASTGLGDIFIQNTGIPPTGTTTHLDVSTVESTSGILSSGGDITVESTGNIIISHPIDTQTTTGNIVITSTAAGGIVQEVLGNALLFAAGSLSITADSILGFGAVGNEAGGGVTLAAGTAGASIGLGDLASSAAAAAQTFTLDNASIIGFINMGGGTLSIGDSTSGDVIIDGVDLTTALSTNIVLSVEAGTGHGIEDDNADTDGDLAFIGGTDDTLELTSDGVIGGNASGVETNTGTINVISTGGNNVAFTDAGIGDTTFSIITGGAGAIDLDLLDGAGSSNMILSGISTTSTFNADTVNGTMTDATTISVGGLATLTAGGAGNGITLGDATADTVNFGTLTFNAAGAVAISEDSAMDIVGVNTAGSANLDSTATIDDTGSTSIDIVGLGDINGVTAISLGTAAATFNTGTLMLNSTGAVAISEDSAMDIVGVNTAGSANLDSTATIDDTGSTSIDIVGLGDINGVTAISLGTAAATFNTGTLMLNSTGAVAISEDSAMDIVGVNTAGSANLDSTATIDDTGSTSIDIVGLGDINGVTAISLGTAAATFNTGTLMLNSTGAVAISEDSAMDIVGVNTAGSANLDSTATIDDTGSTSIDIVGLGDINGVTAISLGTAAATFNTGTLMLNSTGAVAISEDSAMDIVGVNTAGSANLDSTATIDDTGSTSIDIVGLGDINGVTAISLGTAAATFNTGTLMLNSTGAVAISEDSAMDIVGVNTAGSANLDSTATIDDTGSTSIDIVGLGDINGVTAISLGTAAATFNTGTLTFNSTGAVAISEDSAMDIVGVNTAGSANLDSTATIDDTGSTSIDIVGLGDINGVTAISLGTAAATFNTGTLMLNSTGAVAISEDSAMDIVGVNTAGSANLDSTATIDDTGSTSIDIVGLGDINGVTAISLGTAAATFNTGTLMLNSTGAVAISEDSAMDIVGVNTAGSANLDSTATIDDTGSTSIDIVGLGDINGVTAISLGTAAATFNTGTLMLNSTGAVAISEDSAMDIVGVNTAGSANLDSTATIDDTGSTSIDIVGLGDINGVTAISLGTAAATFNTGTLMLNSTGAVAISEDSAMDIVGVNTAGSANLDSTATIDDTGSTSIDIVGLGDINGVTAISLGTAAATFNTGTLMLNSTGTVAISEDSAMDIVGVNTAGAGYLVLTSTAAISDAGATSIDTTGSGVFADGGGAGITLGTGTFNAGALTFTSTGLVTIAEDSAMDIVGVNTAGSANLDSTATIDDTLSTRTSIDIVGLADINGVGSISLGTAGATFNDGGIIGGLTDVACCSITAVSRANHNTQTFGSFNTGTLTFNSTGAVAISEDSAMDIVGVNTAGSANLDSTATIDDTGSTSIDIVGLGDINGVTAISLGTAAATFNTGTLMLNSTGAVAISEDSAMDIVGVNTAGSANLDSTATIDDTGSTSIDIVGLGDINGVTAISLGTGAATLTVGSLTFNSAGIVTIIESDATDLAGSSTAATLNLTGAGITGTGDVIVTGDATIAGGANAITLDSATNDVQGILNISNSGAHDATFTDANDLTLGVVTIDGNFNVNVDAGADEVVTLDASTATLAVGGTMVADGQGTNDTFLANNVANSWTITKTNAGTIVGVGATTNFTDFANTKGGTNTDSFTFTNTGLITGDVDGGAVVINDTLSYADGPAATIVLSAVGTVDGFMGTATGISGTFDNIDTIIGSANTDTITGINTNATWRTDNSTFTSGNVLTFSGLDNLVGGTANDIFNIVANHSGTITDLGGSDTINFDAGTLTGNTNLGAGDNVYDYTGGGTHKGTVTVDGNDIWNHVNGVPFGGPVVGAGNLQIPNATTPSDLIVGAGGLILPTLKGFTGHLVIGGSIDPPNLPLDSSKTININTDQLTINSNIVTNSDISLLAQNVDINADITPGGVGAAAGGKQLLIIATGDGTGDALTGNITGTKISTDLNAGNIILVAATNVQQPENININLAGGDAVVSIAGGQDAPQFALFDANAVDADADLANFLVLGFKVDGIDAVLLNVEVNEDVGQANLAGSLIGLEQLAFIDVGLFEEDLSLYGVIGKGVALSLAQCEEVEGCAPDVTESELDELITALKARIAELNKRMLDASGAEREQIRELLEGYNQELSNFEGYKEQLQEYYSDDDGDDGFGDEDIVDSSVEGQIQGLNEVLEVTQKRVAWLKALKADPEARATLSESSGIELTIEALDAIIEATQEEVKYIENQIRLLQEGTQAMAKPLFWAESGNFNDVHNVGYGSSLLNIGVDTLAYDNNWH